MKTLLVICFVLTVTVLGKESVSDLVSLLENPEVLQEIVKRLGHDDPVEKSSADSSTDGSCQYKNFSNTIIQTKASTAAGAAFLDSQSGLSSNHDCIQRCCELDGCELAVYENKGDRNCYLFRCKDPDNNKNYCEFASLDGYISSSITHDIKAEKIFQTSSNSDHENDLQDLSDSGKLVETSTTSTTTTTTTTEIPELPHSVSIGGVCKTSIGCEDSHAFCLNGICACRTSYYNKHGTCREVCGHSRFECKVVDLDGPDCIRNSLVCDGRKDCHDGSDELNCQTDAPLNRYPHWFQNQFGLGSHFNSQLRHQDYGTQAPEKNILPTPETSVDAAGMAREFHLLKSTASPEDLDSAIKEIKNTKSDETPKSASSEQNLQKMKSKDQSVQIPPATPKPNPVVVWPDSSSNEDIVVPESRPQEPEKLIPKSNSNQHSYQKEMPMDTFIPDSMISSQGKKGPSYFLANKPQVPEPNPTQKTEVDIVPKTNLVKTQRPHPVHDAHMISHPDSSLNSQSNDDSQASLPFPGRKYPKNQLPLNQPGFENYYQPPFHQSQYPPPDLSLADPDERQGDLTPFNRNYSPYNRPQQQFPTFNNQLNYPNRQQPPRNPFTPERYGKNFMYDYPDYESYQPDRDNNNSPDHPAYIPAPGLYNRFDSVSQDDDKSQDKPSNIKTKPHHQTIEQNDDKKIKKPPPTPVNIKNNPKPPQDTHTKELSTDTQQNVSEKNTEEESNEESKSTKVTDESESNQEESKQSTDSSESKDEQTDDQTKESPEDTDTGVESKDEKDFTVEETESLLVSKEKMSLDSPIQTAQGPIIALSLGLGFTFLLLVFIGCRLRNMKRRLRKGRVLHSNEADYLINGMYL